MEILYGLWVWLFAIVQMTATYIFILMGPGLIFGFILHYTHKYVESNAWALLGRRAYLVLFGCVGTMIHEIGHAAMCLPFGHKITEMKLFAPDPNSGVLGYVNHSYNPRNIWARIGNFFIGVGPIILGAFVVWLSAYFLASKSLFVPLENVNISYMNFSSLDASRVLFAGVGDAFLRLADMIFTMESLTNWRLWLFLYILITVGGSMTLSAADIKGAAAGFASIVAVFALISAVTLLFEGNLDAKWLMSITKKYSALYAVMFLAIALNIFVLVPLFILRKIAGRL